MLLAFEQNIMEKIGFIHFAFIYTPIGYYYLVADANDKEWTSNQSQLRSIDFDFQIEYHKSIVCYSVQHSLWARCINIQNNDAIHEQTRDPGTDYYWYSSCSRPIFFLLFFSFTFRWHCVQRACGAPLLQIHRLIFDIQIPAARGAQLL